MSKREQIEAQIQALRLQIEKLEKSLSSQNNTETPWSVVDVGEEGFYFHAYANGEYGDDSERQEERDLNAFKNESTAKGFANAFHVMIALRQCEGAGQGSDVGNGFIIAYDEFIDYQRKSTYQSFSLFPPFSTRALAEAAADKVGRDKIMAAYKFLATGE